LKTVVTYVCDETQSLNEQFREKHPNLPASLTLSKVMIQFV
jgi:hypothetical protein